MFGRKDPDLKAAQQETAEGIARDLGRTVDELPKGQRKAIDKIVARNRKK